MATGNGPRARAILLHGLNRTARSLRRLMAGLREAGFEAEAWSYPSRRHRIADLVGRFRHDLAARRERGRIHLVGHSLGAIVIRGAVATPAPIELGRIVMIAAPNQGVVLDDLVARTPGLTLAYGAAIRDLASDAAFLHWLPVPDAEIGVIAGTRRFHPCNPASYLSAWLRRHVDHDGTVAVHQTKLAGMRDFLALPVNHTFICDEPRVIRATIAFLRDGVFPR